MSEYKKALALRMGGTGLCRLLFGPLKQTESENGLIVESGVGFSMTMDFLLRVSGSGEKKSLLEELIFMVPTFTCYNNFIERLPSFQANEEEVEYLAKLGHII